MTIEETYLRHEGAIYRAAGEVLSELAHKIRVGAAQDGETLDPSIAIQQAGELLLIYLLECDYTPYPDTCVCGAPCRNFNSSVFCSKGVHNI